MAVLRDADLTSVDVEVVTGPLTEFNTFVETSAFTPLQLVVLKAIRKKVGNRLAQRRRQAKVSGQILELQQQVAASRKRLVNFQIEEANVILQEQGLKLCEVRDQPCLT